MTTKPFVFDGVEAEKAEAMRRYNNRKTFRNILRAIAVASFFYLWCPTVTNSIQIAGVWFYKTGAVIITNRNVVFVLANVLIALIFVLSRDNDDDESSEAESDLYDQYTTSSSSTGIVTAASESDEKLKDDESDTKSKTESDLYDQHTTSSAGIVTVSAEKVKDEGDDDLKKQIVQVLKTEVVKGTYRRTKSETGKKIRPVKEYRRTESEKVVAIERLSSEEFMLRVEEFIKEQKMKLIHENDVVERQGLELVGYDKIVI